MKLQKLILLSLFFTFKVAATEIDLSGIYQGKNLYVQNPLDIENNKFCVEEVFLNGVKILSNIESSAFEIDLSHLELNEIIHIRILHHEDCSPKILNAHVIKANVAFNFSDVKVTENTISWGTKGENPHSKFFIEHDVNDNWKIEEEVLAKGKGVMNHYTVSLIPHSGMNKYRIKYLEHEGLVYYSQVVDFDSDLDPIEIYPKRVTDKLTFSRVAFFEITDSDDNLLLKGKEKEVKMSDFPEGVYYINTDNKSFKVYKK